jgi:hypothetical protein
MQSEVSFVEQVVSVGMLEKSSFPEGLISSSWNHKDFSSIREDPAG